MYLADQIDDDGDRALALGGTTARRPPLVAALD